MIKALIAEFIAFVYMKNDERYAELEKRIQQLEAEKKKLLVERPGKYLDESHYEALLRENHKLIMRVQKLEDKTYIERYMG